MSLAGSNVRPIPRAVIASAISGRIKSVLRSQTVWEKSIIWLKRLEAGDRELFENDILPKRGRGQCTSFRALRVLARLVVFSRWAEARSALQ